MLERHFEGGLKCSYIATADIFDKLRVNCGLFEDFLKERVEEEIEFCVFKTAFEGFG